MDSEKVIEILAEFFRDSINEDPIGVGDWFAQGVDDIDAFVEALDKLIPSK